MHIKNIAIKKIRLQQIGLLLTLCLFGCSTTERRYICPGNVMDKNCYWATCSGFIPSCKSDEEAKTEKEQAQDEARKKSEEENSPETKCQAGDLYACYEQGQRSFTAGATDDARKFWQRACDGKVFESCAKLGTLEHEAGNESKARAIWDDACKHANAVSCAELASAKSQDEKKGACNNGDAASCIELAKALDADSKWIDEISAYKRGCDAHSNEACSGLGQAEFLHGSKERAKPLLATACKQRVFSACTTSGRLESDAGNTKVAAGLFAKACRGGDSEGCFEQGKLELKAGNRSKAKIDFKKACDAGFSDSCKQQNEMETEEQRPEFKYKMNYCGTRNLLAVIYQGSGGREVESGCIYEINPGVLKVIQATSGGILVGLSEGYSGYMPNKVFFVKTTKTYVDDDPVGAMLVRSIGPRRYQTTIGAQKTVHAFECLGDKN